MKRSELILNMVLVPVDLLMLLLAGALTYSVRTRLLDAVRPVQFAPDLTFNRYFLFVIIVSLIFIVFYAFSKNFSGLWRHLPRDSWRLSYISFSARNYLIPVS